MAEMTQPEKSELTRFIAERCMGWTIPAGCSDWYTKQKIKGRFGMTRERRASMAWNPTESISDAWMGVEKIMEIGWTCTLAIRQFEKYPEDRYIFHGCRLVGTPQKMKSFSKHAETAPLAICLAIKSALEGGK